MDDKEIYETIISAVEQTIEEDRYLLEHGLSERSITHKLANKIEVLFPEYDVDCEFNGDIDKDDDRKTVMLLKEELAKIGYLKESEVLEEEDLTVRSVYPDIIIHKRGSNKHNLCIIEVKKDSNKTADKFDSIKLSSYTSEAHGNNLKYQLGLYIMFTTLTNEPAFSISVFKNGSRDENF